MANLRLYLFLSLNHFSKGQEDTEAINECARALKALMNSQPGLEAVIGSGSSIQALGQTLDFVTGRMKTVIVEVLSALCLLSPEAHGYV